MDRPLSTPKSAFRSRLSDNKRADRWEIVKVSILKKLGESTFDSITKAKLMKLLGYSPTVAYNPNCYVYQAIARLSKEGYINEDDTKLSLTEKGRNHFEDSHTAEISSAPEVANGSMEKALPELYKMVQQRYPHICKFLEGAEVTVNNEFATLKLPVSPLTLGADKTTAAVALHKAARLVYGKDIHFNIQLIMPEAKVEPMAQTKVESKGAKGLASRIIELIASTLGSDNLNEINTIDFETPDWYINVVKRSPDGERHSS